MGEASLGPRAHDGRSRPKRSVFGVVVELHQASLVELLNVISVRRPHTRFGSEVGKRENVAFGPGNRFSVVFESRYSAVLQALKSTVEIVVRSIAGKVDDKELPIPPGSASGLQNRGGVILTSELSDDIGTSPIVEPIGKNRFPTTPVRVVDPVNSAVVDGSRDQVDDLFLPRPKGHIFLGGFVLGFVVPENQNSARVSGTGDARLESLFDSGRIPNSLSNRRFFFGEVRVGGVFFRDIDASTGPMGDCPNVLDVRVDTVVVESAAVLNVNALRGNLAKNVGVKVFVFFVTGFVGAADERH